MSKQEKLISADKLIEVLKTSDERNRSVGFTNAYFTARDIELLIESGACNPDPVPTINPGDIISDLLFAFINKDVDCPHDFEVEAFENAVNYLREHDQSSKYKPGLFEGYLQQMREGE